MTTRRVITLGKGASFAAILARMRRGLVGATLMGLVGCTGNPTEAGTLGGAVTSETLGTGDGAVSTDATATSTSTESTSDSDAGGTTSGSSEDSSATTDDTGSSTSTSSTSDTGSTDNSGSSSSSSSSDSTTTAACESIDEEPNQIPATGVALPDAVCDESQPAAEGTLDGDGDIDWFVFYADWVCGSSHPILSANVGPASGLTVCLDVNCSDSNQPGEVTCLNGSTTDESIPPQFDAGCCGSESVSVEVDCDATADESADVGIRVAGAALGSCEDYTLTYAHDIAP